MMKNGQLLVSNSLSRDGLVPFIPSDVTNKKVTWYICGPTVYDSAHMGHARAYMTFDIIRRIMEDYYGYQVQYVMNITDVDDKIILRARENYLFNEYINSLNGNYIEKLKLLKVKADIALEKASKVLKDAEDTDENKLKLNYVIDKLNKSNKLYNELINNSQQINEINYKQYINLVKEFIAQDLDEEKGNQVTEKKIFRDHAEHYEREFFEDMNSLNIRTPTAVTRVTEFVDEIIEYIQQIIKNGYGYEAEGNVYFDVEKFAKKHKYAKLCPEKYGNKALSDEGEGKLKATLGKRNDADFALWKKSKRGEPAWKSPFGEGRPGWHIECSVMASHHFGSQMDIHSGGIDLQFPHHDNELAQAEAHYNCHEWVRYFWHAGHLHINGLKMSKSLKNFTTIRQLLDSGVNATEVRLLFLLQAWDKPMTFSSDAIHEAQQKLKVFKEFFLNSRAIIRNNKDLASVNQMWNKRDRELNETYLKTQEIVDKSISNNFDTETTIRQLLKMINGTNVYMRDNNEINELILRSIASYIKKILTILGIFNTDELSWNEQSNSTSTEDAIAPFLDVIASFRDQIRDAAKDKNNDSKVFLKLADNLRDKILPQLGVRLEDDTNNSSSVWKLVDAKELIAEQKEKERKQVERRIDKLERSIKGKERELNTHQDNLKTPKERFETMGYNQFDNEGKPTHNQNGEELSKKAAKKVEKNYKNFQKKYTELQNKLKEEPELLKNIENEINQMKAELDELNKQ